MQSLRRLYFVARSNFVSQNLLNYKKNRYKMLAIGLQHSHIRTRCSEVESDDFENTPENHMYDQLSNEYLGIIAGGHRVLIIQPYIKWGKDKNRITTPELQLEEAEALVKTLPYWIVEHKMLAPLLSFSKKHVLGSGSLETLKTYLSQNTSISAIFFSLNSLRYYQTKALKDELGVEIFDRYSLIIHIFRAHAKSPEAKLQVALAEIPYIRRKVSSLSHNNVGMINLMEHRKKVLESKELNLKKKLERLREHRTMIRKRRRIYEIPVIAVVGYTNAGKTSLIKAITGDVSLKPRNQLFATLDTTAHEGLLPCKMKVLFMDTIGFIQDVPEMLIEPFKTTLEDALVADILVHVYDASHPDKVAQIRHVENTIKSLYDSDPPVMINVANKCDLLNGEAVPETHLPVIAKNLTGIDLLRHRIQEEIMNTTNRKVLTIRVKAGSPEEIWVYKEMTVLSAEADENDFEHSLLSVVATENQIYGFKRYLRQKKC